MDPPVPGAKPKALPTMQPPVLRCQKRGGQASAEKVNKRSGEEARGSSSATAASSQAADDEATMVKKLRSWGGLSNCAQRLRHLRGKPVQAGGTCRDEGAYGQQRSVLHRGVERFAGVGHQEETHDALVLVERPAPVLEVAEADRLRGEAPRGVPVGAPVGPAEPST